MIKLLERHILALAMRCGCGSFNLSSIIAVILIDYTNFVEQGYFTQVSGQVSVHYVVRYLNIRKNIFLLLHLLYNQTCVKG